MLKVHQYMNLAGLVVNHVMPKKKRSDQVLTNFVSPRPSLHYTVKVYLERVSKIPVSQEQVYYTGAWGRPPPPDLDLWGSQ